MVLLALLPACGGKTASDQTVQSYFSEVNGFEAHVKLLSDLDSSVLEYEMDYVYNKEQADSFTITAPESIAGLGGTIAGDSSAEFSLQYDGLALDDAMPQRTGLTPADGLFCLLADLRSGEPSQRWTENVAGKTLLVLRYDSEDDQGKVAKQIWLTADGRQPVCAELYADGECVLTIQVMSYEEKP